MTPETVTDEERVRLYDFPFSYWIDYIKRKYGLQHITNTHFA